MADIQPDETLVARQDHLLADIMQRAYVATSDDDLVTAPACGTSRLTDVDLHDPVVGAQRLSSATTSAVADVIQESRLATARAIADLPGLNPQLRALLLED